MKNLLTVTPGEMEIYARTMSLGQLKDLLRGIREFKTGRILTEQQILDIERKETKIWKELQNRKIIGSAKHKDRAKDTQDFNDWINKIRTKRVF